MPQNCGVSKKSKTFKNFGNILLEHGKATLNENALMFQS